MKPRKERGALWWIGILCVMVMVGGLISLVSHPASIASDKKAPAFDFAKAHAVYQSKCLSCHLSVLDPEKPGRTRDGWFMVVNIMHKQGMDLSDSEASMVVDLLYKVRRGLEKDPG